MRLLAIIDMEQNYRDLNCGEKELHKINNNGIKRADELNRTPTQLMN